MKTRKIIFWVVVAVLVIGLPSVLWAWLGDRVAPDKSYYWFYTERWTDRLGGVER